MLKAISVATLLLVPALFAEINPRYYVEMQKKAPERLRFRVTQVQNEPCDGCETFNTEVFGVVTQVFRTKSKIRSGQKIAVAYSVFRPRKGWVGPRPMPELQKGQEYDFFGSNTGKRLDQRLNLEPGARGYSFDSLIDEVAKGKPL